jgi:sugar/nucleoside kinase (ribokinase family)
VSDISGSNPSSAAAAPISGGVVTIGHAIVDVLGHADDDFLVTHRLDKGIMELVDVERAVPIYEGMQSSAAARGGELVQVSGGSAANTAVVAAMLGAPATFFGKVRSDDLGDAFARDIHSVGVAFATERAPADFAPTGRCLINVTPDAERTMATYLGAARGLRIPDMDEAALVRAQVTYLEGYLWDEMLARPALEHAIAVVHAAGQRFSLSLSDPFCVDRFRAEWITLLGESVDIVFANESELLSLFETDDLNRALKQIGELCEISAITMGAQGSIVVRGDDRVEVGAHHVPKVVDTTGAGDAYAGGFLAAFCDGRSLGDAATLGGIAAAEVISHIGARPTARLLDMAADFL